MVEVQSQPSFTGALIGQADAPTKEEMETLHSQRKSEAIRIYRKLISHLYAQYSAGLVARTDTSSGVLHIGHLRGLAEAWNVPFRMQQEDLKEKK